VRDFGPRYYAVNGRPMALMEWVRVFGKYRHIGEDFVRVRGHTYRVSTVWLGLDHNWNPSGPPLIFETMVFENGIIHNGMMARYSTLTEAQRGHVTMVRTVKRIAREQPRHPQLFHNGRKPIGRRSTNCKRK
jgi:hypothetical protein